MLIIANCEEELSEWLWLEYKHASEIWDGDVVFTHVPADMKGRLATIGKVDDRHFSEIFKDIIVLDPEAEEPLSPADFSDSEGVVVGGILGYDVPKGRTGELITDTAPLAKVRHLGEKQLPIDQAALAAKLVSMGSLLEDIDITEAVEIMINDIESVELPYGYVVMDGKVLLTPGLVDYLSKDSENIME